MNIKSFEDLSVWQMSNAIIFNSEFKATKQPIIVFSYFQHPESGTLHPEPNTQHPTPNT